MRDRDKIKEYKVVVIGGGVLGTSIAYFLSSILQTDQIALIEQERYIAHHTSSRNTGKVHAPFLYDPVKKKYFAKAAYMGFEMLKAYCRIKRLPFKEDGILQVALNERDIDRLYTYLKWGLANGLDEKEIKVLDKNQVSQVEPNVKCQSALYCLKDASVNYRIITNELLKDARSFGCAIITESRVKKTEPLNDGRIIVNTNTESIITDFVINAAGGNAIDIAHSVGAATDYTDIHFRGEYWQAPEIYKDLTKISVYSVPRYHEYPFLDPHWIVRVDGSREVGPNAVPVFGPYAYNWRKNMGSFLPKVFESLMTQGMRKIIFDKQFISLARFEIKSSLSKKAMINRVRTFLPQLKPEAFIHRGTAGIRSSVIDKNGRFVHDPLIINKNNYIHILNYNSPGATGALPLAAVIVSQLIKDGNISPDISSKGSVWDLEEISKEMKWNRLD